MCTDPTSLFPQFSAKMSKIFDGDSDSDAEIKTNNDYARNYDTWRKKEELNKLKTKYGDDALDYLDNCSSSSSSDDDDEAAELNEKVEKEFFKTLSYLKNKDPRIYDENTKFFQDTGESDKKSTKKKKEKPMTIKDYERKLILENRQLSDSEEESQRSHSPTYVEEQRRLKESFKRVLESDEESDDKGDFGGIFTTRKKTEEEKKIEEEDYKGWLKGQKEEIGDKDAESELKPLKDYWSNPKLDDGEKFLRDYILNKRFLNNEDEDYIPTYEEIVHDSDENDEETVEKQEEFEHKYNFRFEEPDQEFIKRYPRTVENSLRKTDDRRKLKRAETKERKLKEKEKKREDLKQLQELKKKEIEEKIEKLKEITGNAEIAFKDEDFEEDFDPEAHDKRMQSLFNEDFYQGQEDEQKPEFPDLDEELELENWDRWHGDDVQEETEPHCEDDDFNMDADYAPSTSSKNELIENSKSKKKRRRKSLFAKVVNKPKAAFDPNDKSYEEYLDDYYKFDCEDFIGDLPCRFKYRKVVPNSFGLTVEEILNANDRELNKWCSLKKAVQYRPDHVERYDQIAFEKKAQNLALKRKVLPSLFKDEETAKQNKEERTINKSKKEESVAKKKNKAVENENVRKSDVISKEESVTKKKNKAVENENVRKSDVISKEGSVTKKKNKAVENENIIKSDVISKEESVTKKKKNVRKRKLSNGAQPNTRPMKKKVKLNKKKEDSGISDARLSAYGINPKKFKNKLKYGKK